MTANPDAEDVLELTDLVQKGTPPASTPDPDNSFEDELNALFGSEEESTEKPQPKKTTDKDDFSVDDMDDLLGELDAPEAEASNEDLDVDELDNLLDELDSPQEAPEPEPPVEKDTPQPAQTQETAQTPEATPEPEQSAPEPAPAATPETSTDLTDIINRLEKVEQALGDNLTSQLQTMEENILTKLKAAIEEPAAAAAAKVIREEIANLLAVDNES